MKKRHRNKKHRNPEDSCRNMQPRTMAEINQPALKKVSQKTITKEDSMKKKTHLHFPLSFFLVQSFFCSNSHHCNFHCHPLRRPPATHAASPLPLPAARSGGSGSNNSSQYHKYLAVVACKSFPPSYAHRQLQH